MFAPRFFKRSILILAVIPALFAGRWYLHATRPAFVAEVRSYLAPAPLRNDQHDTIRQVAAVVAHPRHRSVSTVVRKHEEASRPVTRVESARYSAAPQKARIAEATLLSFKYTSVAVAPVRRPRTLEETRDDETPTQTADDFTRTYIAQQNPGENVDSMRVISQQGNTTTLEAAVVDGTAHLTERIVVAKDGGTYEVVTDERTTANQDVSQACYNGRAWEECHGGV